MTFQVALTAQPNHFEWFIVILVMFLSLWVSAVNARLFLQLSTSLVNICVRPANHFLSLVWGEGCDFTKLAHRSSMMLFAIAARFTGRIRAKRASRFHRTSVPLKQTWNTKSKFWSKSCLS